MVVLRNEMQIAIEMTKRPDIRFIEKGTWDGKTVLVKSKSWTQKRSTSHPLIARWALPPLLSSGIIKSKPLIFDMLDDSTLRSDQILRYTGQIVIPVAGGNAKLDCYAQTGRGIVIRAYVQFWINPSLLFATEFATAATATQAPLPAISRSESLSMTALKISVAVLFILSSDCMGSIGQTEVRRKELRDMKMKMAGIL
jgi:hypothetical protein